jgi:hypothetical protein
MQTYHLELTATGVRRKENLWVGEVGIRNKVNGEARC